MDSKPHSVLKIVLILGALTAFGPLSIDMYLAAFPTMAQDLGVNVERIQLSLTSFFIGLALGQVIYGPFMDRYGRKPPILIGLTIYGIASAFCALSWSDSTLIVSRFFQALGACGGMVASRAIVRDLYDEKETAKIFSLLMLVMGLAPILAPLAGGYILLISDWKSIFFLLCLLSFLALPMVMIYLPETGGVNPQIKFAQSFSLYKSIFKEKRFLTIALAGGIAQAGMFAYITGSPFVIIDLYGVRPENYGLVFGLNAFGLIGASQFNRRLLRFYRPDRILKVAFPLLAVTGTLIFIMARYSDSLWGILPPLFVFIGTLGVTLPNTSAMALTNVGKSAGSSSALLGTIQFSCAVTSSTLVSKLGDGTAFAMSFTMALCGCLSFIIFWLNYGENTNEKPVL